MFTHRFLNLFIHGLWITGVLCAVGRAQVTGLAASPPRSAAGLSAVQWESTSFWGERTKVCRERSLPHMTKLMFGRERSHFVENFRIASGQSEGKHRGPAWNDGDTYKWLEALIGTYAQTRDPELLQSIDAAIDIIVSAQRADGYLHTPVLIAARSASPDALEAQPFGDPANFEMYNFGHLMTAASLHFEVTGERKLLDCAIKAADFLEREFSQPDRQQARHAICPAHYMGIIDLYRVTSESRYLQLAERFLAMRDLVKGGDDNQDRIPFREQREAVGHAVRANYLYAGVADLLLENHDQSLLTTLTSCWNDVQRKKIYVTGGCGALFDGASPDGSKDQKEITRIHQAYGRSYQLPNATAHNETCAAIGYVLWNYRMWQVTGEGKYIDALENSLMNAVLAGVSLDGERYFYTNTLRQLSEMPAQLRWSRQRQEWISCYCCPPNVARTLATCNRYAYGLSNRRVDVLLYGSNKLNALLPNGQPIELTQSSDYPVSGRVSLTVMRAPEQAICIALRVPAWCDAPRLEVNGTQIQTAVERGFVNIERNWQAGDRISLDMPMPVRLLSAHPLVEECRGQVAVSRGPLVYCIESADLPPQTSIERTAVRSDSAFEIVLGDGVLNKLPLLETELAINRTVVDKNELYSNYRPPEWLNRRARLIPYFAWGNRELGEMSVWLQVLP